MFALPLDAERLTHTAVLVSPHPTPDELDALHDACSSLVATRRVTVVATGPWPEGRAAIKAFGCDFVDLGAGYLRKGRLGRARHLRRKLRRLDVDETRTIGARHFEWRVALVPRRARRRREPEIGGVPRQRSPDRVAILLKSDLDHPAANVRQALRTARSLAAAGMHVCVVAPREAATREGWLDDSRTIEHRPIDPVVRTLDYAEHLAEVIAELARDGYGAVYFRQARIASMVLPAAKRCGMRVVMECHQPYTTWALSQRRTLWDDAPVAPTRRLRHLRRLARADREYERSIYRELDAVLCTTDAMRRHVTRLGGTRVHLLRNGAPPVTPAPAGGARDCDVVYSGRTSETKGTGTLLRSVAQLGGVRLRVIGGPTDDDLAPYRALARELGVDDRVRLDPWMDQTSLFEAVRGARVAVHPITGRGSREWRLFTCPLKIVEAMALGVPIVATDLPAIRELLEPNVSALLVPPADPTALAAAIRALLDDPARARDLADAAQEAIAPWTDAARRRTAAEPAARHQPGRRRHARPRDAGAPPPALPVARARTAPATTPVGAGRRELADEPRGAQAAARRASRRRSHRPVSRWQAPRRRRPIPAADPRLPTGAIRPVDRGARQGPRRRPLPLRRRHALRQALPHPRADLPRRLLQGAAL